MIQSRWFFLWIALSAFASAAAAQPQAVVDKKYGLLFRDYCLSCHDEEKHKGSVRLDNLPFEINSIEVAERWQKVLNSLNSGEMPPEEKAQPDRGLKTDFLEHLSLEMVLARKTIGDTGGKITLRRLNRREYKNTIRDLLGVNVTVGDLPTDGSPGTFDTVGSGLFMSSSQFESYRHLGRKALDAAFDLFAVPLAPRKHRIEPEERVNKAVEAEMARQASIRKRVAMWTREVDAASRLDENATLAAEIRTKTKDSPNKFYYQWEKIKGAPAPITFGFVDVEDVFHHEGQWRTFIPAIVDYLSLPKIRTGAYLSPGMAATQSVVCSVPGDWPPGDYLMRIRVASVGALSLVSSRTELKPTLSQAPGGNRRFLDVNFSDSERVLSSHHITGTMEDPQELVVPMTIEKSGNRSFKLRETNPELSRADPDKNPAIWIDWIEFEGPLNASGPVPIAVEGLKFPPAEEAGREAGVRKMLEGFAFSAFRGRAPAPAYLDKLVAIYQMRRKAGESPEVAIRSPLTLILSSPHFLYLSEPAPEKERRPLTSLELATRLAYFLWSAPPDQRLLSLAETGELQQPSVLAAEVKRLLASEKSRELVTGFTRQWLGIDRLDFFTFNPKLYPAFSLALKEAAREEVYATVALLLQKNLSLSRLLDSNEVVVNGLLADYYKMEGVVGDAFRAVQLPKDSPRGGLLGMAAVHAMGSNGEHTSPVERGAWVLRKILATPPPPAPPNVPQLSRLEGRLLTTRERLSAHQQDPQCASCHRKIDPIGLGLENFDAAGQWRTRDVSEKAGIGKKTWEIEPAGAFHNGPEFRTYFELRALIAAKPENFARGFTEALVEYGLGRPCGFSDQELVDQIVQSAGKNGFAMQDFFQALVASATFHTK
jgi:hypothetical protein